MLGRLGRKGEWLGRARESFFASGCLLRFGDFGSLPFLRRGEGEREKARYALTNETVLMHPEVHHRIES